MQLACLPASAVHCNSACNSKLPGFGRISRESASAALADPPLAALGSCRHRRFRHEAQLQRDRSVSNDVQAADPRLAAGPAAGSHCSPCSPRCGPACTMHHAQCTMQGQRCPLHKHPPAACYAQPSAKGLKHHSAMLLTIAIPDPCHACASCMGCSGGTAGRMCLPAHRQLDLPGPQ